MLCYYSLRIDNCRNADAVECLSKYTDCWVFGEENIEGDNPHCHGYIETVVPDRTVRAAIRKRFGSGNGVYSMKRKYEEKPLELIGYTIKEGRVTYKNIDPELIEEAKAHNKKVKEEIAAARKKKKAEKESFFPNMCMVFEVSLRQVIGEGGKEEWVWEAFPNCPKWLEDRHGILVSYKKDAEHIIEFVTDYYLGEKGKPIREFYLVSLVQGLLAKYTVDYRGILNRRIRDKLDPPRFG